MLLNAKFNNFALVLPKDWIYESVATKYEPVLKWSMTPFTTVIDFLNSTVQSISWPSITIDPTKQQQQWNEVTWKGQKPFYRNFTTELTLSFRCSENYLNYFILKDQLESYQNIGEDPTGEVKSFMPDLTLSIINTNGQMVMSYVYHNVSFFGLSELELSYSSSNPEFKSFDIQVAYESIQFVKHF